MKFSSPPKHCVVTGGSGFVGQRLCEMLIERGAEKVVSFDIVPMPNDSPLLNGEGKKKRRRREEKEFFFFLFVCFFFFFFSFALSFSFHMFFFADKRFVFILGDIRDAAGVKNALRGAECVWHNCAAVGPYHPQKLYHEVNYQGTVNVINACRELGIKKIVMSSSPSTRFTGADVDGLTEAQLPSIPQKSYVQEYAASKALGEKALTDACDGKNLFTVAVAPHQVYGPRDNLFLPNILEAAGTDRIRIFGHGRNKICFTHVDNYAHGLIIAEKALYPGR